MFFVDPFGLWVDYMLRMELNAAATKAFIAAHAKDKNMVLTCEQGLAKKWAEADDEIRVAEQHLASARSACDQARSRKENAAKDLAERVGRNIPMKAFVVGTDVVIVELERGIRRVALD